MIVCKFGGTSVANVNNVKNIKKIIKNNENIHFVVVSALGKSERFNKKVTDELYECFYIYQSDFTKACSILNNIFQKYITLSNLLNVKIDFSKDQNIILNYLKNGITKEYLVSRGEYLSAKLFSKYLKCQFLDAKDYIIFKNDGTLNFGKTKCRLSKLNKSKKYVIGGFYGATLNGEIKTFSRGGSDITGAIISKLLSAEIYENYTDVNGVYNKNPNIFKGAENLPILNFKTACQMAEAGNEVVHKDALSVLKGTKTILLVKNTSNINEFGTTLVNSNYIFDDMYVCLSKQKLLCVGNNNLDLVKNLRHYAEIKNIISHEGKLFILTNEIYIPEEELLKKLNINFISEICKFSIFSNVVIDKKNIKKLAKIQINVKKISILCIYLSFNNNFIIICKYDDQQ